MRRRIFFTLPLAFAAWPARSQDGSTATPADPRPRRSADAPKRPSMATLRYDELTPRQRRRAEQAMAREGETGLPADEVRRRWDATSERDRRRATHREAAAGGGNAARRPGQAEQPN